MSAGIFGVDGDEAALFVKQGATLQLLLQMNNDDGTAFDLTGVSVSAQVRTASLDVVATLTVVITGIRGQMSITQATDTWPPGRYLCDLKFVEAAAGIVLKSRTFAIVVARPVTV